MIKKDRFLNLAVIALLSIGITIVGCTIFVFLIHSRISFFGDIDEKTFGIFGDFIGGFVGTLFNIVVTYLVWITYKSQKEELKETKQLLIKQINISYKPDIYIKDSFINTDISTFANSEPIEISIVNSDNDPSKRYNHISLVNIGVAAAKEFYYKWDYDLQSCLDFVSTHITDSPIKFELQNEGQWLMVYTNEDDANYLHAAPLLEVQRFDILLPYKENADEKALSLPLPYMVTYLLAFEADYRRMIKGDKVEPDYYKFPELHLNMDYKDLDNEMHNKIFKINLGFNFSASNRTAEKHTRNFQLSVSGFENA